MHLRAGRRSLDLPSARALSCYPDRRPKAAIV